MARLDEIKKASVSCLANAHYHSGREAALDTVHRWFMFGVVAFGAAAVTDLVPHRHAWLKSAFAATAALLGALDITFDLSGRARTHAIMKRRYFELWGDLRARRKKVDEVRDCLDRYSAEEEPPFRALFLGCWNRAERETFGKDALHFDVFVGYRLVKNILRLPTVEFGEPHPIEPQPPLGFRGMILAWWRGSTSSRELTSH